MKTIISLIIFISYYSLFALDARYHTYAEIKREIDSLQTMHPEIVMVESIGVSLNEHIPIWAIKLSDNVTVDEDEPAVMYAGQVHAEEVLGVEVTMHMINDIISHRNVQPYKIWLQEMEIWFVPSYNPEGLGVVTSGLDVSFRKNKRDNNNNGIFDFVPQPGDDIDGVDMNRNYSFNWIHGDTLYCPDGEERYDYYKGPAFFSEGGTMAIRNLAAKQHFIYSINWHSSRTGNFSEKLFYSFEHNSLKKSPDFDLNKEIGDHVASLITTEDGTTSYESTSSRGRKGSAHDWFYQQHGTIQLLIECGTRNLQPEAAIVDDTCLRNSAGAYWLMNRALGYQTDGAMLTGHITDAVTGEPIEAELIVQEHHASFFAPRMTDSLYGRFYRPLQPGIYTLKVRKEGYAEKIIEHLNVNNSMPTLKEITLDPLPAATITGLLKKNGTLVAGELRIISPFPRTITVENGLFNIAYYQGPVSLVLTAEGCAPMIFNGSLNEGTNNVAFDLADDALLFTEDFSTSLSAWNSDTEWQITSSNGRSFADDSPKCFYRSNKELILHTNDPVSIPDIGAVLELEHKFYVEHDHDSCFVQLSEDNENWQNLATFSGISNSWQQDFFSLDDYKNKSVYLRFMLKSDASLTDPGWKLDKVNIHSNNGTGIEPSTVLIQTTKLFANYPNPFNPTTKISYQLSQVADTNLMIFNAKGEQVWATGNRRQETGNYSITFDGSGFNSGIYFYTLEIDGNNIETRKMVLLK